MSESVLENQAYESSSWSILSDAMLNPHISLIDFAF